MSQSASSPSQKMTIRRRASGKSAMRPQFTICTQKSHSSSTEFLSQMSRQVKYLKVSWRVWFTMRSRATMSQCLPTVRLILARHSRSGALQVVLAAKIANQELSNRQLHWFLRVWSTCKRRRGSSSRSSRRMTRVILVSRSRLNPVLSHSLKPELTPQRWMTSPGLHRAPFTRWSRERSQ